MSWRIGGPGLSKEVLSCCLVVLRPGTGANTEISYPVDGKTNTANAGIAVCVNVRSMGNGVVGIVDWNPAGNAFCKWMDDKGSLAWAITKGVDSLG